MQLKNSDQFQIIQIIVKIELILTFRILSTQCQVNFWLDLELQSQSISELDSFIVDKGLRQCFAASFASCAFATQKTVRVRFL